jgi:hypothetical protein
VFVVSHAGHRDIEQLLAGRECKRSVFLRMCLAFPQQIRLAEERGDVQLAREIYYRAGTLPSVITKDFFFKEGYALNGTLSEGSSITIAYRGLGVYLIKLLIDKEMERVPAFERAILDFGSSKRRSVVEDMDGESMKVIHTHIVPFVTWQDPVASPVRIFIVMPKYISTVETIPQLNDDQTALLWDQIGSALHFLHEMDFGHSDVKPANICLKGYPSGHFVLIDLGSMERLGGVAASTPPYIPRDIWSARLHTAPQLDFWMLAVTMCEKGCGDECLRVGEGKWSATAPPTTDLLGLLGLHVAARVVKELIKRTSK